MKMDRKKRKKKKLVKKRQKCSLPHAGGTGA
jgi:hypothetical protein